MRIIGEKLTNQELLSVKGGASGCWNCQCHEHAEIEGGPHWFQDDQPTLDQAMEVCALGMSCVQGEFNDCAFIA